MLMLSGLRTFGLENNVRAGALINMLGHEEEGHSTGLAKQRARRTEDLNDFTKSP